MSRKGMLSLCKSKQIPRIFQRQRTTSNARSWLTSLITSEDGISVREQADHSHYDLLPGSSYEYQYVEDESVKKGRGTGFARSTTSKEYSEKTWNDESCQINDDSIGTQSMDSMEKTADAETVANIEQWLKVRTDSVSSMDLDTIKTGGNVPGYLGDELPHTFLEKDSNPLSIDIDLSDKKLNLVYDPILHELQNEKLLDTCTKDDEFSLPELQYDPLDPLELAPDMMVAGEILPSTSALSSINVANLPNESCMRLQPAESSLNAGNDSDFCNKSTQVYVRDFDSNLQLFTNRVNEEQLRGRIESLPVDDNYLGEPRTIELVNDFPETGISIRILDDCKTVKVRAKESGIAKKRKKLSDRKLTLKEESPIDSSDGIMAVVAISTDKVSNMTQIVINNGKEEQIYQGKTSELIEATGNFPRVDATSMWNGNIDTGADNLANNQHDLIISSALEGLGITDEILQPVSFADQGKTWICPKEDCNRHFNRLYALKGHLLTHYGVRPFKCDFEGCSWAFYSDFKLKRHRETHLKKKDYVCEVVDCQRRFTTIYNLWSHKKLHQRPSRIVCLVPDCKERFQTKRALEIHMKSHDQSHAPYECTHEGCGKRYYSSNALTSHQRCHSYKETDIKCSWPGCGKIFDKPCRLKAHTRSHTGSKPYLCTFQGCQWAFASSSKLKRHQKKHTNDRKFVCEIASCGKAFMRSEHLKEHRLTHSLERYFQCYVCGSSFSAKSSLYVHIKKHHSKSDSNKMDALDGSPSKDFYLSGTNQRNSSSCDGLALETELQTEIISREALPESDSIGVDSHVKEDNLKVIHHCPVDTCTRTYTSKATLRTHLLKMHGSPVETENVLSKTDSVNSVSNTDYIVYTPYSISQTNDQMIMVAPCDAVIFSSSETDVLAEPESPQVSSVLKRRMESHRRKGQGSARTGLTSADVFKLKVDNTNSESAVGTMDVILGSADLGEGLLLTEELPSSMYFQDDIAGTECQVLLLDAGAVESTINLRDLE